MHGMSEFQAFLFGIGIMNLSVGLASAIRKDPYWSSLFSLSVGSFIIAQTVFHLVNQ